MEQLKEQMTSQNIEQMLQQIPEHLSQEYFMKWKELWEKYNDGRFHITFTGHFSAGKSTLLNHILHGDVLPSSPLPTSSNIVMLAKGKNLVKAYDFNGNVYQWEGQVPSSFIQSLCKRGDVLKKVYIQSDSFSLNDEFVFMDSPGIDSTDDEHRKSTESALHMSDLLVYVTDYHHVQSEINVSFIKKLKEMNKTLLIIVNQIDKHNEDEISFTTFRNRIESTMMELGMNREDIFYTSLKKLDHPLNELERLKERFQKYLWNKKEHIYKNLLQSANYLIEEIEHDWNSSILTQSELNEEQFFQLEESIQTLNDVLNKINQAFESINNEQEKLISYYEEELNSLLKNANIIPYQTREKAANYLKTEDPSFKVGMFFSKRKTEAAKNHALQELHEDLKKQVETQIIWHIRNLSKSVYETFQIEQPTLLDEILHIQIDIEKDELKKIIKQGAQLNDQYVLQFTKDLSEYMKQKCKKAALTIQDKLVQTLVSQKENQKQELITKKEKLTVELLSISKLFDEKQRVQEWKKKMNSLLASSQLEALFSKHSDYLADSITCLKVGEVPDLLKEQLDEQPPISTIKENKMEREMVSGNNHLLLQLKETAKHLSSIEELKYYAERLKERASAIENKSFTIAMFGAFSAGKSSFANALIGQKIFPSSPTPTTAVINRLTGVVEPYQHEDVLIQFKSNEQLLSEINELLRPYSLQIESITNNSSLIEQAKQQKVSDAILKRLDTYENGIRFYEQETKSSLQKVVNLSEIEPYVATEEKACVVQEVTVYYDCELTKKGITLVDTPGASSLHQRHTELAFQYIKKADAIIFLTYFNHPFSKGDEQFLHQLGLVKDTFTMDKMFFIINAIDLAENEEEAKAVKDYVKQMLLSHSIRNPRLFQISSLFTLENQQLEHVTNEFSLFENVFTQFIEQELMHILMNSAKEELQNAIQQLKDMISLSKLDEHERQLNIKKLKNTLEDIKNVIQSIQEEEQIVQLKQELKELNHYVIQRIRFRLSDFFKQAYQPSKFLNSKGNEKEILNSCFHEMVSLLNIELQQELNATTLRCEKFIQSLMEQVYSKVNEKVRTQFLDVPFTSVEQLQVSTPKMDPNIQSYISEQMEKGHKYYKNAKSFFERNEKKKLFLYFEEQFPTVIEQAVKNEEKHLLHYYQEVLINQMKRLKEQMITDAQTLINSKLQTLTSPRDVHELETLLRKIEQEILQ